MARKAATSYERDCASVIEAARSVAAYTARAMHPATRAVAHTICRTHYGVKGCVCAKANGKSDCYMMVAAALAVIGIIRSFGDDLPKD